MAPRNPARVPCPPDHRHAASSTCYSQHRCGCDPCRKRNSAYTRWGRKTPPERRGGTLVPGLGTQRRLQALMWLGYSPAALGRHLGGLHFSLVWRWARTDLITRQTAAKVRRLYDELAMTPLDPQTTGERISVNKTRAKAVREGWVGPLAWDDIDDPNEIPSIGGDAEHSVSTVDELSHLHSLGESSEQAIAALGQSASTLERLARRHGRPDLARWIVSGVARAA